MTKLPSNINTFPVVEQYKFYYLHFKEKYGKVAIFFQNGAHYNFFGTDDFELNVKEIANDVNITLTYRNKHKSNKGSVANPFMCGFPICSKNDYIKKFINFGYVVVEVVENKSKKQDTDALIPREVINVFTPGTFENEFAPESFIVQVYIEGYKDYNYNPMSVGLSSIDINTGISNYYEIYNSLEDESYAIDEINRYITAHSPKELLVYYKNTSFRLMQPATILSFPKEIETSSSQKAFLEKVFKDRKMVDVLDYLDLEMKQSAKISLCLLLYYIYEHNERLISNLKKPDTWFSDKFLLLANNTLEQLDIINRKTGKYENVFNMIDMTTTAMGKRLLKYRLVNPLKSAKNIEQRYDWVERFGNWKKYEDLLCGIRDMTKDHRLIERFTIDPLRLAHLIDSYDQARELFSVSPKNFINERESIDKYIDFLKNSIDVEEAKKYKSLDEVTTNIFKKGFCEKLDDISKTINTCHKRLSAIEKLFASALPKATILLEKDDKLGYYFKLTKAKTNDLKKKYEITELSSRVKSHSYVQYDDMAEISEKLIETEARLNKYIKIRYLEFLERIERKYRETYIEIVRLVAEIDVYKSCAKCAESYRYCRPKTIEHDEGFIYAKEMRHPLIERINDMIYVPNTIKIGEEQGLIIFGCNASGKSSLMKALSINLILAQAGLFVACSKFNYTPYKTILTRILGNDDIFSSLSSFGVEMSELRSILARSGPKTIVLGDEICRGTESISGTAIVAASILELMSSKSNFVLTSHLHELVDLEEIKKLKGLGIYHLKVEREGRKIIYCRNLESGAGDSIYGIEIALGMGIPANVIKVANDIRRKLTDETIVGKKSRYNKKLILDRCQVCGENVKDTHHIAPQKDADSDGWIAHFQKNRIGNLTGLCKRCHKMIDRGQLKITGYRDSTEGIQLEFSIV